MTDKVPGAPEELASPNQPAVGIELGDDDAKTIARGAQTAAVHDDDGVHAARSSFLWHVHDYLGEYARFADTKAAFSGTISGAMLGGLYAAGVFKPMVSTPIQQWLGETWLSAAAALFLVVSIGLAMRTVYPRLKSSQQHGFIYWGNISAFGDVARFGEGFKAQSAETLNDHLMRQAFDVSKHVCVPKYRTVSWCLIMLMFGACLAAASLLLQQRDTSPVKATPKAAVVK